MIFSEKIYYTKFTNARCFVFDIVVSLIFVGINFDRFIENQFQGYINSWPMIKPIPNVSRNYISMNI